MERRVRPWINKKIIEYIGEEEPTLVDFVCSKVLITLHLETFDFFHIWRESETEMILMDLSLFSGDGSQYATEYFGWCCYGE